MSGCNNELTFSFFNQYICFGYSGEPSQKRRFSSALKYNLNDGQEYQSIFTLRRISYLGLFGYSTFVARHSTMLTGITDIPL